jgi:hypothetical protein
MRAIGIDKVSSLRDSAMCVGLFRRLKPCPIGRTRADGVPSNNKVLSHAGLNSQVLSLRDIRRKVGSFPSVPFVPYVPSPCIVGDEGDRGDIRESFWRTHRSAPTTNFSATGCRRDYHMTQQQKKEKRDEQQM